MTHDELMQKHHKILEPADYLSIGEGWFPIIDRLCTALQTEIDMRGLEQVIAKQVKEKFGGLRFYTDNFHGELQYLVDNAENEADRTCDVCGEPGKIRGTGWLMARCDEHAPNSN